MVLAFIYQRPLRLRELYESARKETDMFCTVLADTGADAPGSAHWVRPGDRANDAEPFPWTTAELARSRHWILPGAAGTPLHHLRAPRALRWSATLYCHVWDR